MRHRSTKKTRGFTLPEVLVTITLIAALAAAVVPAITNQLKKGDPSRIGQDVAAIRGGVEQFMTDVRRYPGAVQQVTAPIKNTQAGLTSTMQGNYGAADIARWKGPYLTKDSIGVVKTGFGWVFKPGFEVDTLLPTGTASSAAGQRYMVLKVAMVVKDSLSALQIDSHVDDGNLTTGMVRYRKSTVDTLKFLIIPIS
jgi:prepilin-type N-terminal cleavage/methylation domain-containing protein